MPATMGSPAASRATCVSSRRRRPARKNCSNSIGHPGCRSADLAGPSQASVGANRVYMALDEKRRMRAVVVSGIPCYEFDGRIDRQVIRPDPKLERRLEPDVRFRGPDATFSVIPIRDITNDQKATVRQARTGTLEPYRPVYREQMRHCLARQGRLDRCSMAFFRNPSRSRAVAAGIVFAFLEAKQWRGGGPERSLPRGAGACSRFRCPLKEPPFC